MPDIYQDFPIMAPCQRVFNAVATPIGLDAWWTKRCRGQPGLGNEYELWFGPDYDWRAKVTRCETGRTFELKMTIADDDWLGTEVGFDLSERDGKTWVRFHHTGWPVANEHSRISNHCWAMYLRLLRRYVEHGEIVEYDKRLDA